MGLILVPITFSSNEGPGEHDMQMPRLSRAFTIHKTQSMDVDKDKDNN